MLVSHSKIAPKCTFRKFSACMRACVCESVCVLTHSRTHSVSAVPWCILKKAVHSHLLVFGIRTLEFSRLSTSNRSLLKITLVVNMSSLLEVFIF